MAFLQREGFHEHTGTSVVICPVTLELAHLLFVGTRARIAHSITRNAVGTAVHKIRLTPVLGRQELQVEARFSRQLFRDGFVQINVNVKGCSMGRYHNAGIEIIIVVTEPDLHAALLLVHRAGSHLGNQIPLLRGHVETDGAALDCTHAVVHNLNSGVFLVVETARKGIVVYQYIYALTLKVFQIVEFQVLLGSLAAHQAQGQGNK